MSAGHWSDADREKVVDLIKSGHSRAEIGTATGIGRNAAAGRIFRDAQLRELSRSRQQEQAAKPKPEPKERRMSALKFKRPAPPAAAPRTEAPKVLFQTRQIPKPEARRIPLFELQANECNWPVAADKTAIGGQLFCGATTEEKRGWCPYHAFIGYAPRSGRRYDD
jgi:hypothetical protein